MDLETYVTCAAERGTKCPAVSTLGVRTQGILLPMPCLSPFSIAVQSAERRILLHQQSIYVQKCTHVFMSWGSSVSVSDYRLDDRGSTPAEGFFLQPLYADQLRPTQPPVQWVPEMRVNGGGGVTPTTHPHLVPRSRMSRSYTPLPLSVCMACME
jgi:hypothetical protein